MKSRRASAALATALSSALALGGCGEALPPANDARSGNAAAPAPENVQVPDQASPPAASAPVLTASGYDTIRIGASPSEARGYDLKDDGSYEESCRIYTSPRLPNFYAIVEDGRIMRLTAFHRSDSSPSPVRTDRGIAVGATEAQVRAAYSPLEEQPHHYVDPPAKDLFFGGTERTPGLRFEIGGDGRVTSLHAGLMPVLGYVEGCS